MRPFSHLDILPPCSCVKSHLASLTNPSFMIATGRTSNIEKVLQLNQTLVEEREGTVATFSGRVRAKTTRTSTRTGKFDSIVNIMLSARLKRNVGLLTINSAGQETHPSRLTMESRYCRQISAQRRKFSQDSHWARIVRRLTRQ